MESVPPSASRKRRLRAAQTKQRLFIDASKDERWSIVLVLSQLAMLTSSIDCLAHLLTPSTSCNTYPLQPVLNPSAPEFIPNDDSPGMPVKPGQVENSANELITSTSVSLDSSGVNCSSCWEPLPPCFCNMPTITLCSNCGGMEGSRQLMKATRESAAASLDVTVQVMGLLGKGIVQEVEFYDSCHTLVLTTAAGHREVIGGFPRDSLSAVLAEIREQKIHVTSFLDEQFTQQHVDIIGAADLGHDGSAPTGSASTSQDDSEDTPLYSGEQMQVLTQQFVDLAISQLSESPRWQGVSVSADIAANIVARLRSTFKLGGGVLYSKSQGRKLFEVVERLCGEALAADQ